ncbi:MAG: hypothetical protein E8D45_13570 [Nitrospira sp.]|nr:MAG: hypothetical protein E8D45_13570 [Nitrospira sp.]
MTRQGRRVRMYRLCAVVVMSLMLGMGAAATAAELSSAQKDAKPIVDGSSRAVAQTDGARATGTVGESVPLSSGASVKECDAVTSLKGSAMALVRRLAGKPTPGPGQCPPGEPSLLEHIVK